MKWTLFAKIFTALLLVSLLPLLVSALFLGRGLSRTGDELATTLATAINQQAGERLEQQARQVADDVAKFLNDCEDDLRLVLVAALPKHAQEFHSAHYRHVPVGNDQRRHRPSTPGQCLLTILGLEHGVADPFGHAAR